MSESEKYLRTIIDSKKKRRDEAAGRASRAYRSYERNVAMTEKLQDEISALEDTIVRQRRDT